MRQDSPMMGTPQAVTLGYPRPYWNATEYDWRLPLDTHPHNLEHLEESCLTEWNGWSMEKFMKRLCELHGASFFWCKNGHETLCGMHMCQHASTAQAASRHDHARIQPSRTSRRSKLCWRKSYKEELSLARQSLNSESAYSISAIRTSSSYKFVYIYNYN